MTAFVIALLITIVLAQWFILWVDKAFFEACIAEIQDQGKTIAFLEEQVAAQQEGTHAAYGDPIEDWPELIQDIKVPTTPFLDTIGQGTVVKGPWHSQEDTFQPGHS